MKDHTKEHENPEQILVEHYKMSRNSNSEVSMTVHSGKDLWKWVMKYQKVKVKIFNMTIENSTLLKISNILFGKVPR